MTTDITELAQSLKAEDISSERMEWLKKLADMEYCARNPGHWLMNLKETNYLASLALQCLESNSTLVEALEKAQQLATQQGNIACALFDEVTAQRQRIAELESQLKAAENNEIDARCHIADLESRTVKLPKPHAHLIWIQAGHAPDDYWDDVAVSHSEKDLCCDGSERYPVYARWEIEEMLAAAGIKVEAE
ncbi:nucleotide exchange factor GrpE [Klebsiella quasipneumoniae]|uniref:hypothetical protein n=1 Tax=Klebsiella quasipneumoniae TaxID=1463165 RepID=UPI001D17E38A|nr:hypothetical protein [Klebsiella quasipneumoniae]